VGMALSTSAGEDLTDWTFMAVVAMTALSVVECMIDAGPSDGLLGHAPSVLTTARQEWFLWPSLFLRRGRVQGKGASVSLQRQGGRWKTGGESSLHIGL
jgi:hypothetical protein